MALVEAEIISAQKDLASVVVVVLYRVDGIENSKESMRFFNLTAANILSVNQEIVSKGKLIKNSLESEVEVKKLVGTKIVIENPLPDPVVVDPIGG